MNTDRAAVPSRLAGAMIANSAGTPGTLGCVARTLHDGRPVLLTSWHVLYGNGAREQNEVLLVVNADGRRRYHPIGQALYGRIGAVRAGGEDYYVDCAVSSCRYPPDPGDRGSAVAHPGDLVTKVGAATGITAGVVVDTNHHAVAWHDGRPCPAPRQLLVRPVGDRTAFAAEGDSGAVVVNRRCRVVGLLWGTTTRGEGVACPVDPVLRVLNIVLSAGRR